MNLLNRTIAEKELTFERVCKRFGGIQVLMDVSFTAPEQMVTALIGPNGAGKTTLINLICGIHSLDSGEICLYGDKLGRLTPVQALHKGIARTFQEARVFPFLSVMDNIMIGLQDQKGENTFHALFKTSTMRRDDGEKRQKAFDILKRVGLERFADQPAGELAFGHKKLVGLARAIATDSNLFLLDEPTAGMEPNMIPRVLELIRQLVAKPRKMVLFVEHNMDVVREIADQIVVLMGKVLTKGSVNEVLHDSRVMRDYLGII